MYGVIIFVWGGLARGDVMFPGSGLCDLIRIYSTHALPYGLQRARERVRDPRV